MMPVFLQNIASLGKGGDGGPGKVSRPTFQTVPTPLFILHTQMLTGVCDKLT